MTLVCYTLSSTASYLYCSKATCPGLTWLLAWVLACVLMEMMLARLCCTATTSEFCLLLAGLSPPPVRYNPWYYIQFCISIFYIELEMNIRKATQFQVKAVVATFNQEKAPTP